MLELVLWYHLDVLMAVSQNKALQINLQRSLSCNFFVHLLKVFKRWSSLPCLGHEPISAAAWSQSPCLPHRPRSHRGQMVKCKGQRGKDRQWMMERLTWGETMGREAESETAPMKAITWNKSNGFSSLINRLDMCWEKRVGSSLKLFFKIKIIEDTMNT